MSGFIQRARLRLVLTAAVASQERGQRSLNYAESMPIPARAPGCASSDRWYGFSYWLPGGAGAELGQVRHGYRISMGFGNGLQRFLQRLPTETVIFALRGGVVALHNEWRRIVQNEALDASGDAL